MFSWIIGASLRFRFLVLAMAAALLVFGTQQLRKMPVDVFPEFAPPKVEIQTEGPGMTSTEVEELITIPMEDQLRGVPGVEYVRSSSVVGLSQVVLLFKMGTDVMEARQRVSERLKLAIAELPQSSGMPIMLQPLSATSRVMKIGLTSKVYDMMDLSMIGDLRRSAALQHAGGRPSGVFSTHRRGADRGSRTLRRGSRKPDHSESRRAAERRALGRIDPLAVRDRPLLDRAHVPARHRHHTSRSASRRKTFTISARTSTFTRTARW